MTVVVTPSASAAGSPFIHLAGTIQEVLDELQNQNATAQKVVYYSDDGTNAKTVFCRVR